MQGGGAAAATGGYPRSPPSTLQQVDGVVQPRSCFSVPKPATSTDPGASSMVLGPHPLAWSTWYKVALSKIFIFPVVLTKSKKIKCVYSYFILF